MKLFLNTVYQPLILKIIILLSLVPLLFYDYNFPRWLNLCFLIYFSIEFIYNLYYQKYESKFFIIVDILAILSFISIFNNLIIFKVFRLVKLLKRNEHLDLLIAVLKENKLIFLQVLKIAIIYMFITSMILFNIEPETFNYRYFEAFYWSAISLTTVGYGDYYPVSQLGQLFSIISNIIGIGIIALPTGLIAGSIVKKYEQYKKS